MVLKTYPNDVLGQSMWFAVVVACLVLILATASLVLQSDQSSQPTLRAYVDSQQPVVILYERPDTTSGVTGLVEDGTQLIVVEYEARDNPTWVQVEQGEERGWIQISQLDEEPPS